jgi:hypothetical protein
MSSASTANLTGVMKKCLICQEEKALTSFNILRRAPDGRNPKCKDCLREKREEKRATKVEVEDDRINQGPRTRPIRTSFKMRFVPITPTEEKPNQNGPEDTLAQHDENDDGPDTLAQHDEKIEAYPIEKECSICSEMKPLDAFTRLKNGKYGRHSQCKECRKKERQNGAAKREIDRPEDSQLITCSKCSKDLPAKEFNRNRQAGNGLQSQCRSCHRQMMNERRVDLDSFLERTLKKTEKRARVEKVECQLTLDQLKSIYQEQDGRCAKTGITLSTNWNLGAGRKVSLRNFMIDRISLEKGYQADNVQAVIFALPLLTEQFNANERAKISSLLLQ